MLPISHALSGFITLYILSQAGLAEITSLTLGLSVVFSLIPDIDGLWKSSLKDHHDSILHVPVFWAAVSGIIALTGFPSIAIIVLAATIFHLFTDYVTALTTGVNLFYPVKTTNYHLYELDEKKGDFNPSRPGIDDLKQFSNLYLGNRIILSFELGILLTGIGLGLKVM